MEEAKIQLSPDAAALLAQIGQEAERRSIRVVYVLPWSYAPGESAEIQRQANRDFLDQVEAIMPVLREPAMGVHTERAEFADTAQHLNFEGATRRSRAFAEAMSRHATEKK